MCNGLTHVKLIRGDSTHELKDDTLNCLLKGMNNDLMHRELIYFESMHDNLACFESMDGLKHGFNREFGRLNIKVWSYALSMSFMTIFVIHIPP